MIRDTYFDASQTTWRDVFRVVTKGWIACAATAKRVKKGSAPGSLLDPKRGPCSECGSEQGLRDKTTPSCICATCARLPKFEWITESKLKNYHLTPEEVNAKDAAINVPCKAGVGMRPLFARGGYHYTSVPYKTKVYRLNEVLMLAHHKRRQAVKDALVSKGHSPNWAYDDFFTPFIEDRVGRKTAAGMTTDFIKQHDLSAGEPTFL